MNSGPLSPLGFCSHNVCLVPPSLSLALFSPCILVSISQKDPVFDSVKPSKFLLSVFRFCWCLVSISRHAHLSFHRNWHLLPNYTDMSSWKKRVAILVLHSVVPDLCGEALRTMPTILSSSDLSLSTFGVLLLSSDTATSPSRYHFSPTCENPPGHFSICLLLPL